MGIENVISQGGAKELVAKISAFKITLQEAKSSFEKSAGFGSDELLKILMILPPQTATWTAIVKAHEEQGEASEFILSYALESRKKIV